MLKLSRLPSLAPPSSIAYSATQEMSRPVAQKQRSSGRVSGFSDLEDFWDDLPVSRLEVVWKSSGLLGSLLTKSSGLPGSRLDSQEVVWTSRKSSGIF
ncbi:hypothetical protein YC2023_008159 [Brassica napus]